jgi:hypothetical protein
MIDRDPSFWRGDLTLPDPTDQADLEALLDGCAVLGTDDDPWQGWHPDSVTRTADALASVCHNDARERRRTAHDATMRLTESRLRLDCYKRLLRQSSHAALLAELALSSAPPSQPVTDSERVRFDNGFAALDVVQSLRNSLSDLVVRWTLQVERLEELTPAFDLQADQAETRTMHVRAAGRARAMHLALNGSGR